MTGGSGTAGRWGPLRPFGDAVRFLTIVPVPGLPSPTTDGVGSAVAWFPLVGGLIGLGLVGVGWLAGLLWADVARAALVVVAWTALTGGLHLDGVADTFDAVLSRRPREQQLEIMRDSRIGALGAVALVAVILLKVALLAGADERWRTAALVAPVLGRWAILVGIGLFPSAREDGLAARTRAGARSPALLVGFVTASSVAGVVGGWTGLVAFIAVLAVATLLGWWWTRILGGLTGDTYGALCELAEVVALAAMTATLTVV